MDAQSLARNLNNPDGPVMRAYEPSWRDRIASALMGNGKASPERARFVEGMVGSRGLGNTGVSAIDATPAGAVLDMQDAHKHGDKGGMALAAAGLVPASKIGKLAKAIPEADLLLAMHNTRADRLAKADQLGGLAVPSIAIGKPSHGFDSYGDITLVGDKHFATPARGNPVYASDVYSPRFPNLNDDGTKIFRGFNNAGYRMYRPLTLENVVKEMKGNVRGGEGYNYGAGSIRSAVTPQFRSLDSVKNARDKVIPGSEFEPLREQSNARLFELADEFHPYSKYGGSGFQHATNLVETLQDVGKGRYGAYAQDYNDLPQELKGKASEYLDYLRNMPTEYFEAKPQRGVHLGEFEGAVVPHDAPQDTLDLLQRNGVKQIERYEPGNKQSRIDALYKFRPYMFGLGGGAALGQSMGWMPNQQEQAPAF